MLAERFRGNLSTRPMLLACLLLLSLSLELTAQQYVNYPPKLSSREARALKVDEALNNADAFQEGKQKIKDYFTKYYFARMTSPKPSA